MCKSCGTRHTASGVADKIRGRGLPEVRLPSQGFLCSVPLRSLKERESNHWHSMQLLTDIILKGAAATCQGVIAIPIMALYSKLWSRFNTT